MAATPGRSSPGSAERSVGAEETFAVDIADPAAIRRELLRLAERVGRRARKAGMAGRTVSIKIRYSDFTTITRSRTLPDRTDSTRTIYETAVELLEALAPLRAPLRLVGVRLESLGAAGDGDRAARAGRADDRLARRRTSR